MRDSHPEILEGELGLSGLEALVLKGPSGDEGPTWHPAKVVVQGDEGVEVMNPQDVSTTMIVGSLEGLLQSVGSVRCVHQRHRSRLRRDRMRLSSERPVESQGDE